MSTENGVTTITSTLYKVPTITEYEGKESFAYINPKAVEAITPGTITVGHEYPGSKEVNGTTIFTAADSFFVPMPCAEVAAFLNIELVG